MKKTQDIVTKDYLNEKLLCLGENLREEISIMGESLDGKNKKYKDEILTGLDKVVKELGIIREENTVGTFQIR